jgi:ribosomal protein L29
MTTGERGRRPPDAEHYLDLPDAPEEAEGPHFDVVLRGYDRSQVDEHVSGLRRMVAQLRAQLAVRERRRAEPEEAPARGDLAATLQEGTRTTPPPVDASAASPASAGASPGSGEPGGVEAFNERLRGILQAAEQEAALVRHKAAESLLAEHSESRAALAELRSQRDTVFDELVRVKNHLDELVANSGRPSPPPRGWGPGPQQRGPRPYGGPGGYGPPPGGLVPLRPGPPPQGGPDGRSTGQDDAAGA